MSTRIGSTGKLARQLGRNPFLVIELMDDDEAAVRMTLGGGVLPQDVREILQLALISLEGLDGAEDAGAHG